MLHKVRKRYLKKIEGVGMCRPGEAPPKKCSASAGILDKILGK
jgi:hypothetical protein